MNAKTTRLLKEARSLFWPWCAVIIASALRLVELSHSVLMADGPLREVRFFIEPISFLGLFLGIPLLAALSLGSEFQHRTLPLLLSQPVNRMEIWSEKFNVLIVAVLSAALVSSFGWRAEFQQYSVFRIGAGVWITIGAWIIATIASATFWTLFAKSTLGGLVLNLGSHWLIFVGGWSLIEWIHPTRHLPPTENTTALSIAAFVFLCYAGVMLWLGRRAFARFQATGGMASEDLLTAGPNVMPAGLTGWFRCRPTGAVLNLIRKELRLLRPLWLITLLAVLGWICLALFWVVSDRRSADPSVRVNLSTIIVTVGFIIVIVIAILAGSLSLGEERKSGTHSWHMTLPVSARRQWIVKLFTALLAGSVCAVLLPVLVSNAGGFLSGSPTMFVDPHTGWVWLLTVLLLTFASFWSACAVNGTVGAVLWLVPLMLALSFASGFGAWLAPELLALVVSRFELFANFAFTNAVSNIQLFIPGAPRMPFVLLLLVPTLLLAVIQSYRLFRTQLQDSALSAVRYLLPLAIVAFLCSFSLMAFGDLVFHAKQQMWSMFNETHEAIEKIQPGTASLDATHPLQLTVEDLVKVAPLSERTQRWLRNSRISVASDKPPSAGRDCCWRNSRGFTSAADEVYPWYLATIHLPSGSVCTVSFHAGRFHAGRVYGRLGGVCK
jgi:ABC-type transport system involved in multi-copper enzyme maturation permease subunit